MFLLLTVLVGCGCGKKSEPSAASPTGVILKLGKGAVLVKFPKTEDFIREDWLTLVRLYGSSDTQTLPRIPLADLQTVLVLDVEPGIYRVVAQAWTRKHHPTAGGVLDSVRVESGKITVLRAQRLTGPFVAEPEVPLFHSASQTWTLRSADQLPDFVSEIVRQTVKG